MKGKYFLSRLALGDDNASSVTCEPLVEIVGKKRVLIEHHKGICFYDHNKVCIRVSYGLIAVEGERLILSRMKKDQVVIHGRIDSVILQGGA